MMTVMLGAKNERVSAVSEDGARKIGGPLNGLPFLPWVGLHQRWCKVAASTMAVREFERTCAQRVGAAAGAWPKKRPCQVVTRGLLFWLLAGFRAGQQHCRVFFGSS